MVTWIRGQTIRGRITIWSVVIAAVLTSAAAFAFLGGVDTIVASSTRSLLSSAGASYEASIQRGNPKTFPKPAEGQLVAVVDPSGDARVSSLPDSLNDRLHRLTLLDHGLHTVAISDSLQYDVVNDVVETPTGLWHIIEARNRASGQVVLNGLTMVLIVGVIALVIGFGVSSWVVTGLALRPVMRMRRQASRLSREATADTLPVGPVRDELSALAETLNVFITSVRSSADRERQMVADASHELRTPIAVLRTQLQLAHLSSGDADALEREISAAEVTTERLSNLTTNLLTLSRIEAGDAAPQTSGDAILAEFLACMDRAIILGSSHSVTVDFRTEGVSRDYAVSILPVDFAGLVDNFVSNAIAASPSGSAVDVQLARVGGRLVLTVIDHGHGIPADFLPVAFDRFSRAESSRQRPTGGSGLGLAIVRAIVQRSGGEARLEPRPEGGVRAIAELPLVSP
jgi:signal transduction histidine kinase